MSQQGEAAEQIVNMATNVTVKGVECATNLAGKGALSLVVSSIFRKMVCRVWHE